MGVKQGCPLSPTLFGLCIDKLEELVNRVAKEEKLDAPKLMHQVILLLLYADDVLLFSYDIESMQRVLGVLETFCESSGLTIKVEKTKLMVVRTKQPHQYPTLMYKGEPIQCLQSFKYLGIDIPATNRWSGCFESRLQAGWKSYYMLENQCNQSDTRGWEVKLMLFNAMVTQVLLYGVEVWGGTISRNAWNEIEKIQKMFLRRNLGVKSTTTYQVMLLETGTRPIEMLAIQRVYRYITKVKNMPSHRLPYLAWNVGCKLQKTHKSKILSSGWMVDIRKWFKQWGVEDLLELSGDAMQYVVIEERLMESLRVKWQDAKRPKLEYYIANINPECWIRYSESMPMNRIQPYLITSMSSNSRRGLTLLRTRSHKLGIEVASWHQNASSLKTCKICNEGPVEDEYHLLFICSAYSVIRERFDDILRGCDNLSTILKAPPRRLSTYVRTLLSHREFLIQDMDNPS